MLLHVAPEQLEQLSVQLTPHLAHPQRELQAPSLQEHFNFVRSGGSILFWRNWLGDWVIGARGWYEDTYFCYWRVLMIFFRTSIRVDHDFGYFNFDL
jgi:hypothetical protein